MQLNDQWMQLSVPRAMRGSCDSSGDCGGCGWSYIHPLDDLCIDHSIIALIARRKPMNMQQDSAVEYFHVTNNVVICGAGVVQYVLKVCKQLCERNFP
jgi:hypothetical protein